MTSSGAMAGMLGCSDSIFYGKVVPADTGGPKVYEMIPGCAFANLCSTFNKPEQIFIIA